jgi:hypothetical protein
VLRLAGTVSEPAFTGEQRRIALGLEGDLDAQLLSLMAPGLVASANGAARLEARADGLAERPAIRARLRPGEITVTLRALPILPIKIAGGKIDADDRTVTISELTVGVAVGAHGRIDATVGAAADGVAAMSYGSLMDPHPTRFALPIRGRVTATPVSPVVVDDARFALRADGDVTGRARVSGEILLEKAHVPNATSAAAKAPAAPASTASSRSELARIDLDVSARAEGGAGPGGMPGPNVHVDVDYRITGTAAKPKVVGKFEGADVYSSFLLLLRRIFQ